MMLLGIDQQWQLFSPNPSHRDAGWVYVRGTLEKGEEVIFSPTFEILSHERPDQLASYYPTMRIKKYIESVTGRLQLNGKYFLSYVCKKWPEVHEKEYGKLKRAEFFVAREITLPNYEVRYEEPVLLAKRNCVRSGK
jgi:hypothetical protein